MLAAWAFTSQRTAAITSQPQHRCLNTSQYVRRLREGDFEVVSNRPCPDNCSGPGLLGAILTPVVVYSVRTFICVTRTFSFREHALCGLVVDFLYSY